MKTQPLSRWAAAHPWTARSLIVLIHLILIFGGLATGVWLFFEDVPVVPLVFRGAAVLTLLLFATYPVRRTRYWHRKSYDGAFLVLLFVMVTGWYHAELTALEHRLAEPAARVELIVHQDRGITESIASKGFFQKLKSKRQNLRRSIVAQKQTYRTNRPPSNGGSIVGGVLMILLGILILSYAGLALLCAISCGGVSAGGVALMIMGFGGGIALVVGGVRILSAAQERRRERPSYEYEYEYLEEEENGKN